MKGTPSKVGYVYEQIFRRIMDGRYPPGDIINRRTIANELDVSISPVNEAFALLQGEDIIRSIPRKGSFVNKLDWRDIEDLTNLRIALECEAARVYAGPIISAKRNFFLDLADDLDRTKPHSPAYLIGDIRFHRELVKLGGNRYLFQMFESVMAKSLLLAHEAIKSFGEGEGTDVLSHRILVENLCSATGDESRSLVIKNILSGKIMKDGSPVVQSARPFSDLGKGSSSLDKVLGLMGRKYKEELI